MRQLNFEGWISVIRVHSYAFIKQFGHVAN
jgi:hypothetical protein